MNHMRKIVLVGLLAGLAAATPANALTLGAAPVAALHNQEIVLDILAFGDAAPDGIEYIGTGDMSFVRAVRVGPTIEGNSLWSVTLRCTADYVPVWEPELRQPACEGVAFATAG